MPIQAWETTANSGNPFDQRQNAFVEITSDIYERDIVGITGTGGNNDTQINYNPPYIPRPSGG